MTYKKFTVESGEERWDYDGDIPTREIVDYWVRLGSEVIKKFAYRSDAEKYAKKLNDALSVAK
jgi:hypothetical protein